MRKLARCDFVKINAYNFLLKASGLAQREAAIFHDVRLDTIKGWCGGKTDAPLGALEEIAELILKQRAAADETLEQFDAAAIGDAIAVRELCNSIKRRAADGALAGGRAFLE